MSQLQILDFFYLTSDSCSFLRSHGVPNILRSHTSIRFQSLTNESQHRHHRKAIISCLRDGYTKYFDFAVIGSGVAGLWYAIEVAKQGTVAVITKAEPQESNTNYAQGGVSAVLCPSDSVESHVLDTIVAGAYLCDEETVRDGILHLAREGGHSHHRIVHAADMTGKEIERALLEAVRKDPNIFVFEHHFAIDLLTSQDGSDTVCHGVDTLNSETQEVVRFISKITLLASGGAGHIYPITTNPPV
ncbi:L-aspartate oxidase, chloroplastic [Olea europaea subsp. europaea]|uniref:L-aspartate oxidase, chloroplastic n=1 Tax=Olea europaea subsp. europaea TaxID=158383 RepID=A0A8S0PVC2_OLEEU|nr:L-aspartate oxidase, chloroplastic [Olea europaea subsp. europaea]